MFKIGLRHAAPAGFVDILEKSSPEKLEKLEYFRKLILDHLSRLEKADTDRLKKSLLVAESLMKGGYPVGTVRVWKGQRYVKIAPGKWRPKYDDRSRGAKMAISAIKKRIAAARDEYEMMKIVLEHHDRFTDQQGHPLPFVQELHAYIESQKTVKQPSGQKNFKEPPKTSPEKREYSNTDPNKESKTTTGGERLPPKQWVDMLVKYNDGKITLGDAYNVILNGEDPRFNLAWSVGDKIIDDLRRITSGNRGILKPNGEKYSNDDIRNIVLGKSPDPTEYLTPREGHLYIEMENGKYRIHMAGKNGVYAATMMEDKNTPKEYDSVHAAMDYIKDFESNKTGKQNAETGNQAAEKEPGQNHEPEEKGLFNKGKSDFEKIRAKYQSAASVAGDEDEIQAGKEVISGVWKLVEADIPAASHDETTFHKTPGFPAGKDGSTINDRDYGHDQAAQEAVINIASDYDGRALQFDSPIVVTRDGIVISGNNRTMSGKIAARKGTDAKYIEALKKRARKFGFTGEQVSRFKNPRVVFEIENDDGYSTEQFAKFNQSEKKEMGPTEKAVKVSKLIKPETVEGIAKKISEFDTLGELYADKNSVQHIFMIFRDAGLTGENEVAKYIEDGAITDDGRTFVETAMLGSVMNESNIRGFNRPGCKSIRATLVRAITPLIENRGLTGYSINKELNEAVDIAMQVAVNKDKFKSVDEFSKQGSMFETLDPVAVELAKKLEGTQKAFAEFMQKLNGGLKYAASGEADIFLGGVESKDEIINRFFSIKKAVSEVMKGIRSLFG